VRRAADGLDQKCEMPRGALLNEAAATLVCQDASGGTAGRRHGSELRPQRQIVELWRDEIRVGGERVAQSALSRTPPADIDERDTPPAEESLATNVVGQKCALVLSLVFRKPLKLRVVEQPHD
jgi:hypothetical protein